MPGPRACSTVERGTLEGRAYLMYLPRGLCGGELALAPLLLLFHCYGCRARMEVNKFARAADAHGFVLLAPEGEMSPGDPAPSWNAPSCCGEAMASGRDDAAFADALAARAVETLPVRAGAIFASGFSNGGFMVSHLAAVGRTQLRGIAPTAGHEYVVRAKGPTPVFIHHCAADTFVNPLGCCDGGAEGGGGACCCGIGAGRARCVSTMDIFRDWLKLNGCARQPVPFSIGGAACQAGVGCAANTSLCMHANRCYHQAWSRSFSGADVIVAFFAREACSLTGGAWRGGRCDGGAGRARMDRESLKQKQGGGQSRRRELSTWSDRHGSPGLNATAMLTRRRMATSLP